MKILNLYSGIGGNRKYWDKEHLGFDVDITAVEYNPDIAKIYQDFFPDDTVIVGDAHKYLLEHYKEYDFIWSSPPCPTHSRINTLTNIQSDKVKKLKYPDMTLYQEIIFIKTWFKGKYCIENVRSYYKPLIEPQEIARHYFWTNFFIQSFNTKCDKIRDGKLKEMEEIRGFKVSEYKGVDKIKILRNCVNSYLGLHILKQSQIKIQEELF